MMTYLRRALLTLVAAVVMFPSSAIQVAHAQQNTTVLSIAIRPVFADVLAPALLKTFEDEHPGLTINVVKDAPCCSDPTSGLPQHFDNLQRYVSSADVLYVDSRRISAEGTQAGYFLDLAPFVKADKTLNSDDFYPVAWNAYQWNQGVWALPVALDPYVLGYSPAAFDKAGIAYPNEKWSLDDFASAARKLTQKRADGSVAQAGASIIVPDYLFRSLITSPLIDTSAVPNTPKFATLELATVLDSWLKLENEGAITSTFVDRPPLGIAPLGDVLFQANNPDQRQAGTLLPGGKAVVDAPGFAVSAGTASPDLAYQLAAWLTTRGEVAGSLALLPARKSLKGISPISVKGGNATPDAATQTLLDSALANAIPFSEMRFMPYVLAAYNRMKATQIPAIDALQQAESNAIKAQQDAIAKKATLALSVAEVAAPAPLAAGKVALKFLISTPHVAGKLPNQSQWEKVAQDFAASDPQVGQIILDNSADNNVAQFASAYDCFFVPENAVPAVALNTLVDLDPVMTADKTFDKSDFLGNTLSAVQRDGKTYAFPLALEPLILQVNSDQLTRNGLALPADGWTTEAFQDVLHKLKPDAADPAPFDTSRTDGTHLLALIAAYGGLPIDYRTTPPTINFTDPAASAAIRQTLDLARAGYLQYSSLAVLPPVQPRPGPVTAPVYSDTLNYLSTVIAMKTRTTDKYQPIPYPHGTQFVGIAYNLEVAYVSAQSQSPEGCYRWISALSQHPELFDSMPARHSQVNNATLKGVVNPAVMALYAQMDKAFNDPHAVAFPIPDTQNTSLSEYLIRYWLYQAFDNYVLNGKDLDSSLKDAEGYAKSYQACSANLTATVVGSGDVNAIKPYVACAEQSDSRLKPILDALLGG